MGKSLSIAPGGRLQVVEEPEAVPAIPEPVGALLDDAFMRSNAAGLRMLAASELNRELPAALAFWRAFARRLFQELCHLGEGAFDKWSAVAPPDDEELTRLAVEAPPMRGLEYLDNALLRRSWEELRELVATRAAKFRGGPGAYLQSVNLVWNLLGRVTFHLAENKRDPDRPYAFLATYTHQVG